MRVNRVIGVVVVVEALSKRQEVIAQAKVNHPPRMFYYHTMHCCCTNTPLQAEAKAVQAAQRQERRLDRRLKAAEAAEADAKVRLPEHVLLTSIDYADFSQPVVFVLLMALSVCRQLCKPWMEPKQRTLTSVFPSWTRAFTACFWWAVPWVRFFRTLVAVWCSGSLPSLKSPILGWSLCMRPASRRYLTPDYKLPTCSRALNVFHPYDPLAYRYF
jgi:hypothetical protein